MAAIQKLLDIERGNMARLEEIANSISHGIGFIAVAIIAPLLWLATAQHGNGGFIRDGNGFGMLIFLTALALLYLASTLYHALPHGHAKQFFLKLDYCAIFLVIACTYTAFARTASVPLWNWQLLMVWCCAIVGLVLNLSDRFSHPLYSTLYYLAMGWLTLIAALPMAAQLPHASAFWMIIGGLVYTCGVVFYLLGARLRFSHLGWHTMVMMGSGCHFIALIQH